MSNQIFDIHFEELSQEDFQKIGEELGLRQISSRIYNGKYAYADRMVPLTIMKQGKTIRLVLPDFAVPANICEKVKDIVAKKACEAVGIRIEKLKTLKVGEVSNSCSYCLETSKLLFYCSICGGRYCLVHKDVHGCHETERMKVPVKHKEKLKERERQRGVWISEIPCG